MDTTSIQASSFPLSVPQHLALIMDGNGRWASTQGLPAIAGHKAGAQTLKKISKKAWEIGIQYVTVYAFSTENWHRPRSWIEELLDLLTYYLKGEIKSLLKNNIRLHVIGDGQKFPLKINKLIAESIEKTKDNSGLNLIIALDYGSRSEITKAIKTIANKMVQGHLSLDDIDEHTISQHLYTASFPDPDLLIRTGNEMRVSNFLLWQIAYTELYFSHKMWPDFNTEDLEKAVRDYQNRERRYGTTPVL